MASIMKVKFVSDLSKSAIGRYSISKQFQSYKEKKNRLGKMLVDGLVA